MHYDQGTNAYIVKVGSLNDEDQAKYNKLMVYVEGLGIVQWVARGGHPY